MDGLKNGMLSSSTMPVARYGAIVIVQLLRKAIASKCHYNKRKQNYLASRRLLSSSKYFVSLIRCYFGGYGSLVLYSELRDQIIQDCWQDFTEHTSCMGPGEPYPSSVPVKYCARQMWQTPGSRFTIFVTARDRARQN
ncbi:hypothetical protein AVEN_59275-1 [Araneus ventricosus]|uniref:Uncharacterized protein n=1 Tax=Araneus ventricosus TaxID=182803 RepID=A0A4Y2G2G8_ARAVE|nr:hypothetical protein AVEN_59275-1 [Araneus ventricosus]